MRRQEVKTRSKNNLYSPAEAGGIFRRFVLKPYIFPYDVICYRNRHRHAISAHRRRRSLRDHFFRKNFFRKCSVFRLRRPTVSPFSSRPACSWTAWELTRCRRIVLAGLWLTFFWRSYKFTRPTHFSDNFPQSNAHAARQSRPAIYHPPYKMSLDDKTTSAP